MANKSNYYPRTLRLQSREVQMYAEADYSEGTTTYMWIMSKIQELAQSIVDEEKSRLAASISDSPKHLN
ncbi:hypothetical protein HMPREF0400_00486 [Fusobacterium periodonticum 1_1_41FAA]|uniref:Uncharacterized protein n=1 Tax=Fusobacterium periodonticum 1_1_41FAA TaxID=469621 RepID=D6LFJ2_9FUSO|nr:hypothetical protein HMPREF0400_00486 [Fusobacterium periodonticum 1_1_41FAA]